MNSKLRIIPLGGLGEIGKNMTVIEYEDEILIIDVGIMFPANDMLGIDTIIPDYNYLMDKLDHVKGILITHGHEDHVGALPYFLQDVNAPIYATPLTKGLIEVKLRQARLDEEVEVVEIQAGSKFDVGQFTIEPFHVAHSIPDCVGFGITTPVGLIVHTGDYKFDHTPADGWPPDFAKLAEFSTRGVLCLLADSTNADRPGWTQTEQAIEGAFDDLFRDAPGRVIVASFASLISRIQQVADMSAKYGRKLAITGRSMRENTKMARRLGYLEIDDDMLVDISEIDHYSDRQVTIMATGSQGEPTAVMGRLARGRHNRLQVKEGDTIVFSAHAIPGNEEIVYRTINQLFRQGANVLYENIANVHVSGHASQEEMKLLINLVKPKFLIPIHGELRHLKQHAVLARGLAFPEENIAVVENGTPLELTEDSLDILPRMKGGYVFVDGAGIGDISWRIVRDRDKLSQSGFFFAVVTTNGKGDVIGEPEFVTKGFINLAESPDLIDEAEENIRSVVQAHGESKKAVDARIEESLNRFFYAETGRRPMVKVIVR
ncbi:MAG: ribonuclease J [Chloroflexota bacterium]